jgi:hypothetical protein
LPLFVVFVPTKLSGFVANGFGEHQTLPPSRHVTSPRLRELLDDSTVMLDVEGEEFSEVCPPVSTLRRLVGLAHTS